LPHPVDVQQAALDRRHERATAVETSVSWEPS